MLQSYREQGEKEKSELVVDGKRLAEKLQSDAERSIANELNAMQRKIENDLLTSSLAKAETLLKEKVNMMDHSRLTQDYLSQIEKRNHSV
jgi:F0F1-type ATP synthase membrane subunit b/b'